MLGLVGIGEDRLGQAEGQGLRLPARIGGGDSVEQRLQLGLVLECSDPEELGRLVVIGAEFLAAERPSEKAEAGLRLELDRAEAEQRRPVPLGLAADVVELVGDEARPLPSCQTSWLANTPSMKSLRTLSVEASRGRNAPFSMSSTLLPAFASL